ncbi:aldo/keto reductase [Deinococcus cellulosilyticus]|uniref:Oxidoreductase n=1 Tax=Deinococcus cellulosilyticus (strain DSM 18568 / NBRC 106333 / KACC 11606 / 5516J-15) TaxID=1223518 RepID=A0A511N1Q7_DEIC1|nr:aldo/keto reductase [Deinococcus cellulosilyticus]GEM46759.1 oxidoreductase [Deinococcus cellulosilyticus NBRC 106333 = KACC 11606]
MTTTPTARPKTFKIGGELEINRLGFGAMRITGPGIWGEPEDPEAARQLLRRTVELGVNFIDTADAYGPDTSEILIREALHPYAEGLVIATKGGNTRQGPNRWAPVGRPEYLRQAVELSLRKLKLDRIDLWQLHRIDPKVPRDEQFGVIRELQDEGKIRFVGLSEVTVEEIEAARKIVDVVTVQNLYNLSNRQSEAVLDYTAQHNIGFIPWFPLATGNLAREGGVLDSIARKLQATPSQVALAWLLKRSPNIIPIPGTSSIKHFEENQKAADLELSDEDFAAIQRLLE